MPERQRPRPPEDPFVRLSKPEPATDPGWKKLMSLPPTIIFKHVIVELFNKLLVLSYVDEIKFAIHSYFPSAGKLQYFSQLI